MMMCPPRLASPRNRYERAARELLISERRKLDEAHEAELRRLRTELESEAARNEVSSQMRMKQREEAAHEETEGVKAAAGERIEELESQIEELEGQVCVAIPLMTSSLLCVAVPLMSSTSNGSAA